MLIAILAVIIGIYLVVVLLSTLFQSRIVYRPVRSIVQTPGDIGLSFEAVELRAADGTYLYGWYLPTPQATGCLLFCHGNGGNISHRLESLALFTSLNLSVFIFDYRGYGNSRGRLTEDGTYQDTEAAWNYLVERRQLRPDEIVIFGRSLGGAMAARLAQSKKPAAVILESAFTSIADVGRQLYPYLPIRLLARYRYPTLEYVGIIESPLLVIHSRDDDVTPLEHGRRIFEAAREPKEFLEISGRHADGFLTSGDVYIRGVTGFLEKHLSGS